MTDKHVTEEVSQWLQSRIKSETGKSLEEIEKDWSAQLTARHDELRVLERERNTTVARFFEKMAEKAEDRVFLVYGAAADEGQYEGGELCAECCTRVLTYRHADHASNSVAAWAARREKSNGTPCGSCKSSNCSHASADCKRSTPVAALMMHNSPEFVVVFLGLLKAGITVALLHPQLRGSLLRRALQESEADMLICDDLTLSSMRTAWLKPSTEEIDAAVSAVLHDDEGQPGSYPCSVFICGLKDAKEDAGEHKLLPQVHSIVKEFLTEDEVAYHKQHVEQQHDKEHKCKPSGFPLLLKQRLHHLSARSKADEQKRDHMHERECPDMALPCCCLYTADLEGHLRATWVSNSRFLSAGLCWVHAVDLTESDRLLLGVQLCHEVGLHALAAAISCRGALLLRSRCSLLSLWPDVKALDATIIFHTGMLWSRLLKAHERFNAGDETQRLGSWVGHPQLRASIGTGLPGELWPVVKSVFNIPRILEFYSPRNLQTPQILFNAWSIPGAFGFVPDNSWNSRELERIVKFDEEREEIFRDPVTKMGMAAPRDERTLVQRGELVSQVNPEHGICLFTGEGKTEQYLYKDLLKSNDIWCRSGDIVERDAAGTSFLVDGMAAPLLDLGKLLGRLPGVFGARVQGLPVFSNKEREQTNHNLAQENIKTLQGGWPKTIFELLEAGEQNRRVKCLLACIHVKLGANDSTEEGELGDNRTYTCCPPSIENSLIVIGNEEEASGWKREDGNQAGNDAAMITLRAFLRRLRTSIDRGIQLSIRPNVLKLCFSICQSGDRDLKSKMCTCKPCKAGNKDGGCNNGCCGDCSGNACHRKSLEDLCGLLDSEESGKKGSSCKDRGCHRSWLLFYADSNGDAFVPLTKENFKDFVRESFPMFGL